MFKLLNMVDNMQMISKLISGPCNWVVCENLKILTTRD